MLRTCLDAVGRTVRTSKLGFLGERIDEDFEYNSRGLLLWQSVPHFSNTANNDIKWHRFGYDRQRRLATELRDDDVDVFRTFDGLMTTTEVTGGQKKYEIVNALGEVTGVTDDALAGVSYIYNAAGDLTETRSVNNVLATTPKTITVTMEYDAYGRKTKSIDPDKGTWEYTYNAFGELVTQIDAKGQRTTQAYDVLGRLRTRVGYIAINPGAENPTWQEVENSTWVYDDGDVFGKKAGQLMVTGHTSKDITGTVTGSELKFYWYDDKGRNTGSWTELNVDGSQRNFSEILTYDQHGRVFQHFDMPFEDRGTEHRYNARGYLEFVKEAYIDPSPSVGQVVYIHNKAMDALGNVTSKKLGNRTITRSHDQASGRLLSAFSVKGVDYATADSLVLTYDVLGNLKSRHRSSGNPFVPDIQANESYCYDTLNRLTKVNEGTLTGGCNGPQMEYDAFGNLTKKGGQKYDYPTGAGVARPHAVTRVKTLQDVTIASYTYDANGNMTDDSSGRTFTYSVFDQMTQVTKGSNNTLAFTYGIDRQRNYRRETVGGTTTKTFYQGNAERVEKGTTREIRRRIGGEVVVTHSVDANGAILSTKRRYQLLDHLGSPVAVYDSNATVQERLSFGTWGNRRNHDATLPPLPPYNTNFVTETVRGYTGHEHGDAFGIIHMNGRIYDPNLGRMLQADPFIQFPTNTQSYNRYSYVLNNPLAYTDPSGYFLKELFNVVVDIAQMVYGGDVVSPQAWANLAKDIYLLAEALNEEFKSNPSSFNFSPGVAPGAFTNLTGPVQAGSGTANRVNPYPWDPTAGSIIGATYSDMTGGNFPNGATSRTFSILIVGQPEEKRRGGARKTPAQQFRDDVIEPTLDGLGIGGDAAEELMLGTAIQESNLTHRTQLGGGPGLGLYQMEPATHDDIWNNYLIHRPDLAEKVSALLTSQDKLHDLQFNDGYATAMARVHYYRVSLPLPSVGDITGQASYWKAYYNTPLGKGTTSQYINNWKRSTGN